MLTNLFASRDFGKFTNTLFLGSIILLFISPAFALNPWDFERTANTHGYNSDWQSTCDTEFGSNADVADWTQVKTLFNDVTESSFNQSFMDRIGMTSRGSDAFVFKNGDKKYQSDRSYFMTRHNYNAPGHYMVHGNIDSNLVSLGSWDSSHPILCYLSTNSRKNTDAPEGSLWIEGPSIHWADGSKEYWVDNIELVNSNSPGDAGSLWIEGSYLHWIDQEGDERRYQGNLVTSNPSASSGFVWVENGGLHYIDGNGEERKMTG